MQNLIMDSLNALKGRLDTENTLAVQSVEGFTYTAKFEFNDSALESDLDHFQKETGWSLPDDYKKFLLIHNGALLFAHVEYAGGFDLLSLKEIPLEHLDYMPKN